MDATFFGMNRLKKCSPIYRRNTDRIKIIVVVITIEFFQRKPIPPSFVANTPFKELNLQIEIAITVPLI